MQGEKIGARLETYVNLSYVEFHIDPASYTTQTCRDSTVCCGVGLHSLGFYSARAKQDGYGYEAWGEGGGFG